MPHPNEQEGGFWDAINTPLLPSLTLPEWEGQELSDLPPQAGLSDRVAPALRSLYNTFIREGIADETSPLSLAVNLLPPLSAVKRFKNLPSVLAKRLGEIQEARGLSGGEVPVYHGTGSSFGNIHGSPSPDPRLPNYLEDPSLAWSTPGVTDSDNVDFMERTHGNAIHRKYDFDNYRYGTSEEGLEPLETVYHSLEPYQARQFARSTGTWRNPAEGPRVIEEFMDLSDHAYSPWDLKSDIDVEAVDRNLKKQGIYDRFSNHPGVVLDPMGYPYRKVPSYPMTPAEDFSPQITTWDTETPRRYSNTFYPPDRTLDPDRSYSALPPKPLRWPWRDLRK